jgi:phosphatidylcholine synthase
MRLPGISVHVLTALGAGVALLALDAAVSHEPAIMFFWLGVALVIDGVDGPLARKFKVTETSPRYSGEVLDLVVDFTTYVFVPAYAIIAFELMPVAWGFFAGPLIVVTGALYFADRDMKTEDNHFRGCPAVWNLIAFYLLLLRPAPWIVLATIVVFAALTFAPVRFVHPLRVVSFRSFTIVFMVLWGILAMVALMQGLAPGTWVTAALCLIAVYFLFAGLLPSRRAPT